MTSEKVQPVWYKSLVKILSTEDPEMEAPALAERLNAKLYPDDMEEKVEAKTIKNKIKSEGLRASCKAAFDASKAGA